MIDMVLLSTKNSSSAESSSGKNEKVKRALNGSNLRMASLTINN
jgi:hypothetical protein